MDDLSDLLEIKYQETFKLIYNTNMNQLKEGKISIKDIKALLWDQYVYSDQDWLGRGEIKDTINHATIAALETIISNWQEDQ